MFRKGGDSVAYVFGSTKKIHTTFPDGSELVEEYDGDTHRPLARKRRKPSPTGVTGPWDVLLGEPGPAPGDGGGGGGGTGLMQESSSNPRAVRADTPGHFTWRVLNAPWPRGVYAVALDAAQPAVVVSTSNKKYFKRLPMPEMELLGLAADASRLTWDHAGTTLTINYAKPPALLAEELADTKAAAAMRAQQPPTDCRQQ